MSGKPQRLIALLAVLQVRRVTTAEALAAEFGVSVRTILRDIQALIDADIPVLTERGKYGGISLLPGSQADLSKLTASEADEEGGETGTPAPRGKTPGRRRHRNPCVPSKRVKEDPEGTVDHHASLTHPELQEITIRWRGSLGYMAAWAGPGDDTDEEIRLPHRVPRRRRLGLRPL